MNLFGRLNHFGAIIGAPKLAQNPELMLPHEFTDGTERSYQIRTRAHKYSVALSASIASYSMRCTSPV